MKWVSGWSKQHFFVRTRWVAKWSLELSWNQLPNKLHHSKHEPWVTGRHWNGILAWETLAFNAGWWCTYPSEKYESQNMMIFPNIWKNNKCSKAPPSYWELNFPWVPSWVPSVHDASDNCYVSSYAPIKMSETILLNFFGTGKLPKFGWFIKHFQCKKQKPLAGYLHCSDTSLSMSCPSHGIISRLWWRLRNLAAGNSRTWWNCDWICLWLKQFACKHL
jgi:hypothetical protein